MTLTEFLLARIAEDEAQADGAGLLGWATFRLPDGSMDHTEPVATTIEAPDSWFGDSTPEEVGAVVDVVFDARRARAECEAKRAIVSNALFANEAHELRDHQPLDTPTDVHAAGMAMGSVHAYTAALRSMASVYSTHPDYDPSWSW